MIKNLLRGLTLESLAYNLSMVAKPKLKCLLRHPTTIPVRPERVTTLLHFEMSRGHPENQPDSSTNSLLTFICVSNNVTILMESDLFSFGKKPSFQ